MKTQQQRSAERKKRDKADYLACMERDNWTCRRCGKASMATTQMHHAKRKHLHVRHDAQWHYALCYSCHDDAHRQVAAWDDWMKNNPNEVI